MPTDDQHIKTYTGLGVHFLSREQPEHIAECPFCNSDKMYVNVEEGFFSCKVCGNEGNKYTFMQRLYDQYYSSTSISHYAELSKIRGGLSEEAFRDAELAFNPISSEWWIPVRNEKGSIVNIRQYSTKSGILSNLGGCKVALYNLDRFNDKAPKVIVCEGEWDAIAMEWFLTKNKVKDISVLAVPGASSFKADWAKLFTNKEVLLCYDNDNAGRDGMSRSIKIIRQNSRPKAIKTIVWPESTPERFDVRDYITRNRERVERGWKEFVAMLEDVSIHGGSEDTGVVRTEFAQVVQDFRNHIHVDEDYVKGMLFSFAVVLSNKLGGEPLWLTLVGPPGCIARDQKVRIARGGRSWNMTMEQLYYSFHNHKSAINGRPWDLTIPTMIQHRNEEDGTVRLTELKDVVSSGVKRIIKFTTEDGKTIETTEDHRFMTNKGWMRAKELRVGRGKVCVVGDQSFGKGEGGKRYITISGLRNHPNSTVKNTGGVLEHRIVVEAGMNKLSKEEFIQRIKDGKVEGLRFLSKSFVVHHKNGDTLDNKIENLEVMNRKEHSKYHDNSKNVLYKTKWVKITGIKSAGVKQTFDVCVDEPHNFICEGFVVHNSGKTLLLNSLAENPYTHYESSLAPKTLVSGYKERDGSDPSLLPRIIGKTLIIKEYTEIMALSGQDQDQLFGVLRGAYDGRVERTYPNGVTRVYPDPASDQKTCHFSILAGVTNAIHGDSRAALGERFLKFQLFPDDYDPTIQVDAAIQAGISGKVPEFILRPFASAFIQHKMDQFERSPRLPVVPKEIQQQIIGLAQVISMIRATVARKQGELLYRPTPEIGTRLAKQLIKFLQLVSFILDKTIVDDEVYRLVQRLGLDTCYGWSRSIVEAVAMAHPDGILKDTICKEKRMSSSNCSRALEDLYELGALDYEQMKTGTKGNPPKLWKLSPLMEKLFRMSKINEKQAFAHLPSVPLIHRAKIRRRGRETFNRTIGKT